MIAAELAPSTAAMGSRCKSAKGRSDEAKMRKLVFLAMACDYTFSLVHIYLELAILVLFILSC